MCTWLQNRFPDVMNILYVHTTMYVLYLVLLVGITIYKQVAQAGGLVGQWAGRQVGLATAWSLGRQIKLVDL